MYTLFIYCIAVHGQHHVLYVDVAGNGGRPEQEEGCGSAFLGQLVDPVSRVCRAPDFVL